MKKIKKLVKIYNDSLLIHGDSNKSLLWPTIEHAKTRYEVFAKLISNNSVIDYGCGCGGFLEYLLENQKKNKYYGVDANPEFIKICKKKFSTWKFDVCQDYGVLPEPNIYDYIILNGVFTVKNDLSNRDMIDIIKMIVSNLFNYCHIGICANFKFTNNKNKKPNLFYICPQKIINIFKSFSEKHLIINNYDDYEYSICLFRKKNDF